MTSPWVYRKERASRRAAKLLENWEASHRRIQKAKGYDQQQYDGSTQADEES